MHYNNERQCNNAIMTFYNGIYSTGKAETSKLVVEDLVSLESCCGIVRDFHAGRQSVEDSVAAEDGIALVADEDTCLSVAENVVLLEDSCPSNAGRRNHYTYRY